MSRRTDSEKTANDVDCDLERLAREANGAANRSGKARWNDVAAALLSVRKMVRELMHQDDRKTTR
jgi:hypothetical protein